MKRKDIHSGLSCRDLLFPGYFLYCRDFIEGTDNTASFIKVFERLETIEFPVKPQQFVIAAELIRNENVSVQDFIDSKPQFRLILRNPEGKTFEFGEFPVSSLKQERPWFVERIILDLGNTFSLTKEGVYAFQIYGKTDQTDFELITARSFAAILTKPENISATESVKKKNTKNKAK